MAEVASESWWIKLGVMYDKSGFKAAIGGMFDLRRAASNLADTFKKVVDANSGLYTTSKYLNVSTNQLQIWERAFRLVNGTVDEARQNIENLNYAYDELRLGMGGQKAEIAARLHLNPDDLVTFETAMDALNRSFNTYFQGDRGTFTVLAKQLGLSQSAIYLVTSSMKEYHDRLRRAASIPLIPDHQLKAARDLQEQFEKLKISWDNFKSSVMSASFPAINKLFQDIEKAMSNPEVQKGLVQFFDTIEKGFNKLIEDVDHKKLIEDLAAISRFGIKVLGAVSETIEDIDHVVKGWKYIKNRKQIEAEAAARGEEIMKNVDLRPKAGSMTYVNGVAFPTATPAQTAMQIMNYNTFNINGAKNPEVVGKAVVNELEAQRAVQTREKNSVL